MPVARFLILGLVLLVGSTPVVAGSPKTDPSNPFDLPLREVATPDELHDGEVDAVARRWAELLPSLGESPLLELVVLRMRGIFSRIADPSWMEESIRRLLEEGKLSPYNRTLIREELGRVLLRAGNRDALAELDLYDDILTHWRVVGPFGFRNGTDHTIPYPPEEHLDLEGVYPGYSGPVSWVGATRLPDRPWVSPFRTLYPAMGCVYALCQFKVEEVPEEGGVLHFQTVASAKVWINDDLRVDAERLSKSYPARWFVAFPVRKGWNRILIKLSGSSSSMFSARVLDGTGRPFRPTEEPGEVLHELGYGDLGTIADLGWELGRFLDRLVDERGEDPYAHAARALFLLDQGLDSEALASLKVAAESSSDPYLEFLLAETTFRARHLPRTDREQRSARLLDRVLKKKPDLVPALMSKANRLHADDRSEEGISLLRRCTELSDHFYPHVALARIFESRGWEKEWREAMDAAWALAPGHPMIANDLADFWNRRSQPEKALALIDRSLATDAGQTRLRSKRASLLRDLGRVDEAIAQLEEILVQDPERVEVAERLAAHERNRGNLERAGSIRRELVDRFPRYSAFRRELADVLWRSSKDGVRDEAIQLYEEAIDQAPGYHSVRDLLLHLDDLGSSGRTRALADDEEIIFSLFQIDPMEIIRDAPSRRDWPTASSIAVFDDVILRIYSDGSTRSETQQIFRIFDARGIEEHGTLQLDGEIMDVRTILPDGRIVEPVTLSDDRSFTMPALAEGAFVHMRYFTRTPPMIGRPLQLPTFYFRDVGMADPFVRTRYIVIHPEDMELEVKAHDFDEPFEEFTMGENRVYVFELRNMSAAKPEKFMPDPRTTFPRVTIEQARSIDEIGSLYRRELLERIRPTVELRNAAEQVTGGMVSVQEKAEALYRFVRGHVRNEAGSTEATAVLVTREGSQLFLYLGLLRVLDIPFAYGRARSTPELDERPEPEIIDEHYFRTRVIEVLPAESGESLVRRDRFLVGEDFDLPFGQIATALRGGPVLWVTERGARRATLPDLTLDERVSQSTTMILEAQEDSKSFDVSISTEIPSVDGFSLKSAVRTMVDNRRRVIGMSSVNVRFPGGIYRSIGFPGVEDEGSPFRFEVKAQLPFAALERIDGARSMRVPLEPLRLSEVFASGKERVHPIHFLQYDLRRSKLVFELNGMFTVRQLPANAFLVSPLGTYEISYRSDGGDRIVVERSLEFTPHRIGAEGYEELIEFCRAVDAKEKERIAFEAIGDSFE